MATAVPQTGPGDLSTFNIQHGFTEALVRGMRSSFLKDADYHHLTQCESLDDVRLNLSESDYSDSIAEFNSLTPNTLQKAAVDKVRICFSIEIGGFLFALIDPCTIQPRETNRFFQVHVDRRSKPT